LLARPVERAALNEPRAWLITVAHGLVVDHARRQALERAYLEAVAHLPEAWHPSPEARLMLLQTLAGLDAMLDGLPAKARMAFLLSRLEGLTYPQIAEQLGVCLSSVEKYMASALRHCLAFRVAATG
jgi:RNA polymerase sigma-70 factor (ECF subfamily)